MQQWDDLPLLLVDENSPSTRSCYRTVGGMIDTEIIGVTLWAIWSGYINAINFEHEHTNPVNLETEEARTTADIALRNYHLPGAHDLRILTLFNSRLKQDIYMLPYHQQAIANDLAFEHKQDRARQGPKVITQRLSPRLIVDYELLTSHQIELYHEFWARVPSDPNLLPIATINKGRLVIDLDSMDTTEIFMNTTAEYRNATDHFMDYTELFTQPTENFVYLGLPDHYLRTSIQQSEDTTDQATYS